jgi:hypothetical protein
MPALRALRVPILGLFCAISGAAARAQLTDVVQTPNVLNSGIQRSLERQIGLGRGDPSLPDTSTFLIQRDPFRAIARGRQLFQRKFTAAQGLGPRTGDGNGNIELDASVGAGLADSCASCHGRPFGAAGFGGNVHTRPESRDAPHLFGLGIVEMIADEITLDLRGIRSRAIEAARELGEPVAVRLESKGIGYGTIVAHADGTLDTSNVNGVDPDLRVRPFFAEGRLISIREFVAGALDAEMGLEAFDPDLALAGRGVDVITPAGMVLSGSMDSIAASPSPGAHDDPDRDGVRDEVPASLLDVLEFYLLNYFRPAMGRSTQASEAGRALFESIGCAQCHVPDLWIERDRRVADVETCFDELRSNRVFNLFYATAAPLFSTIDDGVGLPALKRPLGERFFVHNIFADFKRHDLGRAFHERNYDGSITTEFMTEPLWGVAATPPYGHDGRSQTLDDVILRHGGEAQRSREAFEELAPVDRERVLAFLGTLSLFAPPDTASNLDPADPLHPDYPLRGHGSIDLSVLFNSPIDKE